MIFQSEGRLDPVNPVLEAVENVAELVPDIGPQEGPEQEHVEEHEGHEARVQADRDVCDGVVKEGEQRAAGHLVDSPGLDQDWIKWRVSHRFTENYHNDLLDYIQTLSNKKRYLRAIRWIEWNN